MTSPRALLLSVAATICGFVLVLVVIAGEASHAGAPVVDATLAPRSVAVVAQAVRPIAPVALTVAWEPAVSRSNAWGR